jgi:hypothetical protein
MFAHISEQRPLAHPEGDGNGEEDGNGGDGDIEELVWMAGEDGKEAYEKGGGGKRIMAYIQPNCFGTGTIEDTRAS